MAEEEPWLGLAEAAARTGLAREAIRSRARRGLINSRKGNDGRVLVQIPTGLAEADPADDRAMTDLLAEIAELRTELARSIAERDAAVTVGEARVAAKVELVAELRALLAEARRPWWRRLFPST